MNAVDLANESKAAETDALLCPPNRDISVNQELRISTAKLLLRRTGKLFHKKHQRLAFQRIYAHSLLIALERKYASSSSSSISLPQSSSTPIVSQTPHPQTPQHPSPSCASSRAERRGSEHGRVAQLIDDFALTMSQNQDNFLATLKLFFELGKHVPADT